jgi:DNA polymerase II small subunit/DNA polymerase delta subunit B
MYEEEENDIPKQYRNYAAYLQSVSADVTIDYLHR